MLPVLALALSAAPLTAQVVRGVVVDEGSQAPVEGAMVVLLLPDGTVVNSVLTAADGGFIMAAGRPGPHAIRIDRIGYESLTTDPLSVPVEGLFRRIEVPIRPVELVGLDVEAERRCAVRSEQGRATARVWEEARKALSAAALTLASDVYRYTLLHYVRELDADGRRTLSEERRFQRTRRQAPYASAPPDELVELGFMRTNDDGSFTYLAPDAAAFLSDAFLDTHCMHIDEIRDGSIGLAFEPLPGRRVSDIEGTLWIDAATAKLERLEFGYVNLPPGHEIGGARGAVVFGSLPGGTWIVRDWYIRMPLLAHAQAGRGERRYVRTGFIQEGGGVWRVTTRDGATVLESTTATLTGVVVDSLGAGPVAGVVVVLRGLAGRSVTDGAGAFLLAGLPEGAHEVELRHPSLDTLRLGPVVAQIRLVSGEAVSLRLRLPGVGERLEEACGAPVDEERAGAIVFGTVSRTSAPAAGARVRLLWLAQGRADLEGSNRAAPPRPGDAPDGPRWAPSERGDRWIETTLDERGIFMFCRIPGGSQVRIEVGDPERDVVERTVTVPRSARIVTLAVDLARR